MQRAIDQGKIVVAYRAPQVNDGKSSYLAGHNPGIMSFVASLQVGDTLRLSDATHYRDYRVIQSINGDVPYYHLMDDLGNYAATDYALGVNEEHLVLQFCINGKNRLFLAVPV